MSSLRPIQRGSSREARNLGQADDGKAVPVGDDAKEVQRQRARGKGVGCATRHDHGDPFGLGLIGDDQLEGTLKLGSGPPELGGQTMGPLDGEHTLSVQDLGELAGTQAHLAGKSPERIARVGSSSRRISPQLVAA